MYLVDIEATDEAFDSIHRLMCAEKKHHSRKFRRFFIEFPTLEDVRDAAHEDHKLLLSYITEWPDACSVISGAVELTIAAFPDPVVNAFVYRRFYSGGGVGTMTLDAWLRIKQTTSTKLLKYIKEGGRVRSDTLDTELSMSDYLSMQVQARRLRKKNPVYEIHETADAICDLEITDGHWHTSENNAESAWLIMAQFGDLNIVVAEVDKRADADHICELHNT